MKQSVDLYKVLLPSMIEKSRIFSPMTAVVDIVHDSIVVRMIYKNKVILKAVIGMIEKHSPYRVIDEICRDLQKRALRKGIKSLIKEKTTKKH